MTDEVPTRYARTAAGHHLAYQVLGEGPPDLLIIQSSFVPVDAIDEEPRAARFHRRLASFSRVVRFDLRGMGLSDPVSPDDLPSVDEWLEDAVAVLDAVGVEQAAVLSPGAGSAIGLLLAAAHPERVRALIVVNGSARVLPAEGYDVGVPELMLKASQSIDPGPGDDPAEVAAAADLINPSVAHDPAFRAWWDRSGRRGAGPAMALAVNQAIFDADVRRVLPLITVPTLIVHRTGERLLGVAHGRFLAEHIPGATFVELPGDDSLYFLGDAGAVLGEIEEFLTGTRRGDGPDRQLTTVLFTDIVGSTELLATIGEQRWRDLLDHHEAAVRKQLGRFGGRQVKTTGDGVLATFDGPSRAVLCATAVRDACQELGLELRAGVHTGEVEVRGDDIGGMSVHIGARVAALAGPGEILVSRTVADVLIGSGLALADRGEHELKGVPGRWRLFAATG